MNALVLRKDAITSELSYQHQHAERSCPFGEDGGHDRLGMRDQPWMIDCTEILVS